MNFYDFRIVKFAITAHNPKIPLGVILWETEENAGWYSFQNGNWYGSHITKGNSVGDYLQTILIDQATETLKTLNG